MARDIKLLIAASAKRAEGAIRELQRTGSEATSILERDFNQLGTTSSRVFDQKRRAAKASFERIKKSGIATADELVRAEKALGSKLAKIDEEQFGKRIGLAEKFKKNRLKIAAGVAAGIAAVGVTAVTAGKAGIDAFEEFETALVDMGKVTEEPLEQIREKIMAMPAELGSATDLVKGYYQVISAGVTEPRRAMDMLTVAAKASKAAHVDQAETIKALTKLMAGYSGEIESAAEASDLLFAIEKVGQTSFGELVPVIGDVASLSKQAGVNQLEMAAALSQITQTAGSTSQAATQYRAVLMGLIKPQKTMTDALDDLGFSSGQAALESLGFAGTLQQLEGWAQRSGVSLGKLFESSEALTGLGPLLASQFEGYTAALQQMESAAGSTDDAFGEWTETFAAVKDAFNNTLNKVLIDLGRELVPEVIRAMKGISSWITENRATLIDFFKDVGRTIGGVSTQVVELVSGLSRVRSWTQAYKNDQIGLGEYLFTRPEQQTARLAELGGSASSSSMEFSEPLFPGLAVGTAYVPRTGIYQLHQGEEVRTRTEVSRSRDQEPQSITIQGGLNVTLQGGGDGTPQNARVLARELYGELQNLGRRYRTA